MHGAATDPSSDAIPFRILAFGTTLLAQTFAGSSFAQANPNLLLSTSSTAATERYAPQASHRQASDAHSNMTDQLELSQITNQQAALSAKILFKVLQCDVVRYSYKWNGNTVETQKVQSLLITNDRTQYCLGNARMLKKNKKELEDVTKKFATGTLWQTSAISQSIRQSVCLNKTGCARFSRPFPYIDRNNDAATETTDSQIRFREKIVTLKKNIANVAPSRKNRAVSIRIFAANHF